MPNIQEDLQKIMDARYGKDVRKSIYDAIYDINEAADHAEEAATGARDSAQEAARAAHTSESVALNASAEAIAAKNASETARAGAETAQHNTERIIATADSYAIAADNARAAAVIAKVAAETAQAAAETAESGAQTAQSGAETAKTDAQTAQTAAETARTGAQNAQSNAEAAVLDAEAYARGTRNGSPVPSTDPAYENNSKFYSEQIGPYALDSEAYAKGTKHGTPVPSTDPAYENNSKYFMELANYWYLQAKAIAEGFSGALIPMGTVAFANLPALSTVAAGSMYNISDEFTTTSDFVEGAGHVIPMGANVYKTNAGKWDVLAGSPVTGVKGSAEQNFRQGNVEISKANIGLGNVPNTDFTADVAASVRKFSDTSYQTVDQLAYNPTTKKLGLKVGGADTVIPFSGGADAKFYFNNVLQNSKVAQLKASNKLVNPNKFEGIKTDIPYDTRSGAAIILNNKIEVFGGTLSSDYKKTATFDLKTKLWSQPITENGMFKFVDGSAVVYNDEVYLLGGTQKNMAFYKRNAQGVWNSVGVFLPYEFYKGQALVYNNEIHILGSAKSGSIPNTQKHYKWDGTSWTEASTLPFAFHNKGAVVYNNEIHILGGPSSADHLKHYKWDGTSWTEVSTMPFSAYKAVVLSDGIHIFGGGTEYKDHYRYDSITGTWTQMPDIPLPNGIYHLVAASPIVYDDNSFYIVDSESYRYMYRYVMTSSTVGKWEVCSGIGLSFSDTSTSAVYGTSSIVFNNELHFLGAAQYDNSGYYTNVSKVHLSFDGSSVQKLGDLPYNFAYGLAVVLNNELHILGGYESLKKTSLSKKHYKWDGTSWTEVSTLPIAINNSNYYSSSDKKTCYGCACVYNNELYLFGWNHKIYKFNGSSWDVVYERTPAATNDYIMCAISYNKIMVLFEANTKKIYTFDGVSLIDTGYAIPVDNFELPYYEGSTLSRGRFFAPKAFIHNNEIHLAIQLSNGKVDHLRLINDGTYTNWTRDVNLIKGFEDVIIPGRMNNNITTELTSVESYGNEIYSSAALYVPGTFSNFYLDYEPLRKQSKEVFIKGGFTYPLFEFASPSITGLYYKALFSGMRVIVDSDNIVHFIGSNYNYGSSSSGFHPNHFCFDGENIIQATEIPYTFADGFLLLFNNEIHALYSTASAYDTNHYKFNGTSWEEVSTLPTTGSKYATTVCDGKIYLFTSDMPYAWDGTSWTQIQKTKPSTLESPFSAITYNNVIYLFSSNGKVYSFTETDGFVLVTTIKNSIAPYTTEASSSRPEVLLSGDYVFIVNKLDYTIKRIDMLKATADLQNFNNYIDVVLDDYGENFPRQLTGRGDGILFSLNDNLYEFSADEWSAKSANDSNVFHYQGAKFCKIIPNTHYYIESGIDDITLE